MLVGLLTIVRATMGLSWEDGKQLPLNITKILYIATATSIFDAIIMWFYMTHRISRLWTFYLNISQIVRIGMLLYALTNSNKPVHCTNAYFATCETLSFIIISLTLRTLDYIHNGSTVGRIPLTIKERQLLITLFMTFVIMTIGALVFTIVEKWSFHEAYIFVNVTALTIGYGDKTPKTNLGKILIVTIGNILLFFAGYLVILLKDFISPARIKQKRNIIFFLFLVAAYVLFGAFVFSIMEGWSFLDATFFTWFTVNTVGYGSIVLTKASSWEFWIYYVYFAVSLYAFGLGILNNSMEGIVKRQDGFTYNDTHITSLELAEMSQIAHEAEQNGESKA